MSRKKKNVNAHKHSSAKKPYLTKKEIILTVSILIAIIAIVVCFNLFYDDGALKLANGAVQTEGEYSLVVNGGQSQAPRYFKVGQTNEVEGYTLADNNATTDSNVTSYAYTANEGTDGATSVSVSGSPLSAENALINATAYRQSYLGAVVGEVQNMDVDRHKAFYHFYTIDLSKATDEEAAPEEASTEETPAENAPVEEAPAEEASTEEKPSEEAAPLLTGVKGLDLAIENGERSVVLSLSMSAFDGADLITDDALMAMAQPFIDVISYETK